MKKRKLNKRGWIALITLSLVIIFLIVIIMLIVRSNSIPYKLEKIGYKKEEINNILKYLTNKQINDDILTKKYESYLDEFLEADYFIYENLDRYLMYIKENKINIKDVITIVNTNRDYKYYTNIKKTNIEKGELMLVNKYYALDEAYVPKDLVDISLEYSYAGNKISQVAYKNLIEMLNAAKKEGFKLIVANSYKDYHYQERVYRARKIERGLLYADKYVARAGHSEHQSGYAVHIGEYKKDISNFENSEAYKWLQHNAHRYGFIERYKKEQSVITGISAEPWHYRYVGLEAAKKIHSEDLTFEEYYAYYIEKAS